MHEDCVIDRLSAMYKLKFESRTDSTISRRIADLLTAANINNELVRDKRGLDHGVSFKV